MIFLSGNGGGGGGANTSLWGILQASPRRVPRGSVVKCLTRNPGVTESSGFFRGSGLGQDTSEPQPSAGETQERHE